MKNQKIIDYLNQLLSNYFVMYVKLHRYHWYIQGQHFFQLHEQFEEMYTMFAKDLDEIAERILMIDGKPLATMAKYINEATIIEASADDLEEEMMNQLLDDFQQIVSEIKNDGIAYAEDVNDQPTMDMLVTLQMKLEKYIWMLHAYQTKK